MRVISGTWKGRRLDAPTGLKIRPTTDRVKEAIFNILGAMISGSRVVDLCCGTGSLGIEALSRGSEKAVFVDNSKASLSAAEKNLCRCQADRRTYELVQSDGLKFLQREIERESDRPMILLCDPPYASEVAARVLEMGGKLQRSSNFLCAVVEYGAADKTIAWADDLWESRRYGRTSLAIMRKPVLGADHV